MNKPQQQRILISLALALLAHALLFLVFTSEKQNRVIAFSDIRASISVTLDAINIAASTSKKNALPKIKKESHIDGTNNNKQPALRKSFVQNKTTQYSIKQKPVTNLKQAKLINKSSKTSEISKTSQNANKTAIMRAKVIARLRNDLKQFFYYPNLAKRKQIQGTVRLGFGISQTGMIYDIRVVKTSGYAILDLAAEHSMQQLHKVNWTNGLFAKADIALELPITYKLVE